MCLSDKSTEHLLSARHSPSAADITVMRGQVLALLELTVWETEHNHLSLWSVWWQLCYKEWDKQPDKSWADGGVVGTGCRILWDKPRKVVLLDDFWAERRSKRGSEPCRFRQGNVPVEIMVKARGQGHGGRIKGPARAGGGPWRWGHKGAGTFHVAVSGLWSFFSLSGKGSSWGILTEWHDLVAMGGTDCRVHRDGAGEVREEAAGPGKREGGLSRWRGTAAFWLYLRWRKQPLLCWLGRLSFRCSLKLDTSYTALAKKVFP